MAPFAVEHLNIHRAEVRLHEAQGTIWLEIPAPRCEGDETKVAAFLTTEKVRLLRDACDALLARLGT